MSPAKSHTTATGPTSSVAGYSGKPLWQKLGLKDGMSVLLVDAPEGYPAMLGEPLPDLTFLKKAAGPVGAAHVFATSAQVLSSILIKLRKQLNQDGMVWVSWPKKSSKLASDIDDNKIREIALPLGFVDIKVCTVDLTWSGLKLVIRKSARQEK